MTHGSNSKLVLIVDDTPTNVGVISGVLKGAYRTKVATNGEKALVLASAAEKPDLILLDVMMPGMNGLDVYRRLATAHPGSERRIVFMSGGTIGSDVLKLLDGLPNERIAKPFTVDQLLGVIAQTYGGSK